MVMTGLPPVLNMRRPSLALAAAAIVLNLPAAATLIYHAAAFSSEPPPPPAGAAANNNAGFDRFRADCPASPAAVARFDPSLVVDSGGGGDTDGEDMCTYVAVYRSANNLPSVILRDELFSGMRIATTPGDSTTVGIETSGSSITSSSISSSSIGGASGSDEDAGKGVEAPVPLAVGRLRPSPPSADSKLAGSYVLDDLRCSLKKEDTDPSCDGGSEHTEALGVCIDELVLHRLRLATQQPTGSSSARARKKGKGRDGAAEAASFDGSLRCKATLVSGPLLRERGFQELEAFPLPADMATHISSLDGCMERYASRAVDTATEMSVGARERALKVLSLLGQLDREEEKRATKKKEEEDADGDGDGDDGYDPWANFVSVQGR